MPGRAIPGFRVLENFALVISNDDAVGVPAKDVFGIYWHLASATGGVNDVLWHGIAGGMATELVHELKAFTDTGSEMR